jgi:hypothetical protein
MYQPLSTTRRNASPISPASAADCRPKSFIATGLNAMDIESTL